MKKIPQATLNSIFKSNSYPKELHRLINKKDLDKLFAKNKMNLIIPKLQSACVLPKTEKPYLDLREDLKCTIEKNKSFYKLYVVFRSTWRLGNFFKFIDPLKKNILSGTVYCYALEQFIAIHLVTARLLVTEKISVIFFTRVSETSNLTEKHVKEVRRNCTAHGSAHLFITAISSQSDKERKQAKRICLQYSCPVTMINIVKKHL